MSEITPNTPSVPGAPSAPSPAVNVPVATGAVPPKPAEAAKVQPKKETVRISLPPKQTAAPTIKLPTTAVCADIRANACACSGRIQRRSCAACAARRRGYRHKVVRSDCRSLCDSPRCRASGPARTRWCWRAGQYSWLGCCHRCHTCLGARVDVIIGKFERILWQRQMC